ISFHRVQVFFVRFLNDVSLKKVGGGKSARQFVGVLVVSLLCMLLPCFILSGFSMSLSKVGRCDMNRAFSCDQLANIVSLDVISIFVIQGC
ncbi:hypothetical protein GCK32_012763, partial [Trichostrongylus colubriformis]